MRLARAATGRGLLALGLAASLAACGGGGEQPPATTTIAGNAPALDSFDVYAIGNDEGNVLFADIYGITLNPLGAQRLTVDKRISSVSAAGDSVVVAAGDEQIDKLALVAEGGALVPIPGLGRPNAFTPQVMADGTIRFRDQGPGEEAQNRYVSYDPATGRSKVLYESKKGFGDGVRATPFGLFTSMARPDDGDASVVLVARDGSKRRFAVAPRLGTAESGKSLLAIDVFGSGEAGAPPTDTVLLDPKTGEKTTVEGWAPLAWSPDGEKLLVVRAADTRLPDAELAVLDPANPDAPEILGTIPGLTFFQASWVDRTGS